MSGETGQRVLASTGHRHLGDAELSYLFVVSGGDGYSGDTVGRAFLERLCGARTGTRDSWLRRRTCQYQQLHSWLSISRHQPHRYHVIDGHVISRRDDRSVRTMTSIADIFVPCGACARRVIRIYIRCHERLFPHDNIVHHGTTMTDLPTSP